MRLAQTNSSYWDPNTEPDAHFRKRLVRDAKQFLRTGRLFFGDRLDGVINDYDEICLRTQLSIAGICNLEYIAAYVVNNSIQGAFVECGTWRGGAIGFWARSFVRNGGDSSQSSIYGFDSFQGMPRMSLEDGEIVCRWLYKTSSDRVDLSLINGDLVTTGVNVADEAACRNTVINSGYPADAIHIVRGWFQHTLPEHRDLIGPIAVLRLDADLYRSTLVCLEQLYDQVIDGGVVIIDDYGCFDGCKQAVDEYLSRVHSRVTLIDIDYSSRFFFKICPSC